MHSKRTLAVKLTRISSFVLIAVGALLAFIPTATFVSRVSGWQRLPFEIRSTAFLGEPAMERGDAAWLIAITACSCLLIWAGVRSVRTRIPIIGCFAAALLMTLTIETNFFAIVTPLTAVSVLSLFYKGYINPRNSGPQVSRFLF
jgi:hypothetical protein